MPPPLVEPTPRWIRVRAGDTEIANSRRALLLAWYGPGRVPTYCLPPEDVRTDLFQAHAGTAGDGFLLAHDVRTGDMVFEWAAQLFRDPPTPLQALNDHWSFSWEAGLSWFEEALEVHVHARDPHKRVDVLPSERHVRVELDGETLAETSRAHALFETTLPTRWYLPPEDVRQDLLVRSGTISRCPYKGTATYWSVRTGAGVHRDVAWTYAEPVLECPRIAGLVAFFNEKVDLIIDGAHQERPRTPWTS